MENNHLPPLFKSGDRVRALESYGENITAGTVYEVISLISYMCPDWFTYSEYVAVIGDHGRRGHYRTERFEKV